MTSKKGDKTVSIPAIILVAGFATVGVIATEICKVISGK